MSAKMLKAQPAAEAILKVLKDTIWINDECGFDGHGERNFELMGLEEAARAIATLPVTQPAGDDAVEMVARAIEAKDTHFDDHPEENPMGTYWHSLAKAALACMPAADAIDDESEAELRAKGLFEDLTREKARRKHMVAPAHDAGDGAQDQPDERSRDRWDKSKEHYLEWNARQLEQKPTSPTIAAAIEKMEGLKYPNGGGVLGAARECAINDCITILRECGGVAPVVDVEAGAMALVNLCRKQCGSPPVTIAHMKSEEIFREHLAEYMDQAKACAEAWGLRYAGDASTRKDEGDVHSSLQTSPAPQADDGQPAKLGNVAMTPFYLGPTRYCSKCSGLHMAGRHDGGVIDEEYQQWVRNQIQNDLEHSETDDGRDVAGMTCCPKGRIGDGHQCYETGLEKQQADDGREG